MFSFGGLSHEQVCGSMERFATRVMPALQETLRLGQTANVPPNSHVGATGR